MKAIKKTHDNLISVANSICEVDFSLGKFSLDCDLDSSVVLSCAGRDSIGRAVICKIPCNYSWRVCFLDSGVLKLYIWL